MKPIHSHMNEKELLLRLKGGDRNAFNEIYNEYWQRLFLHANRVLQDEDEAMDVVQECFEKLFTKGYKFAINTSLKGYLFTAVRNQTLNAMEKSKRRSHYLDDLAHYTQEARSETEETVLFNELSKRIDDEILNLPPRMRQIFVSSRLEGKSHKEIATEMDISENTVKTVLGRTLKVLRGKLSFLLLWYL